MARRSQRFQKEEDNFQKDDEPTTAPVRKKPRVSAAGWGQFEKAQKVASGNKSFLARWKPRVGEDEVLLKFLDDEPFGSYALHWVDELQGKKGWACLRSLPEDQDCPLCDVGNSARARALLRVLVFDGRPEVRVLEAGPMLGRDLAKRAESRHGPLSRHYWAVSAVAAGADGKSGVVTYDLQVVREDEIEEDWDITPPTREELEKYGEKTFELGDVESIPSQKELADIVRALS